MITTVTALLGLRLWARGLQVAFLSPRSTEKSIDPGACGGMQHLCKVAHQHYIGLRGDARKNTACDRACRRTLGRKLATQGLDKNESRGLESFEMCHQPGCFFKSRLDPKTCSLS